MRKRIRDLAVEVLVALAVVCLIIFGAYRSPQDSRLAMRWVGLAAWTAVAFGYPLVRFRSHWRYLFFWLSCAVLLAIHLAAYAVIFRRMVVDMGSLLIFLITMAEIQVIVALLTKTIRLCAGSETPRTE